jgi:hypothetical protein
VPPLRPCPMHARSSDVPRSDAVISGARHGPAALLYNQVSTPFLSPTPLDSQPQSIGTVVTVPPFRLALVDGTGSVAEADWGTRGVRAPDQAAHPPPSLTIVGPGSDLGPPHACCT